MVAEKQTNIEDNLFQSKNHMIYKRINVFIGHRVIKRFFYVSFVILVANLTYFRLNKAKVLSKIILVTVKKDKKKKTLLNLFFFILLLIHASI